MAAKTTSSFLYFRCALTHIFQFLHDLGCINLSVMFFDKNDIFDLQIQNVGYRKCIFMIFGNKNINDRRLRNPTP